MAVMPPEITITVRADQATRALLGIQQLADPEGPWKEWSAQERLELILRLAQINLEKARAK